MPFQRRHLCRYRRNFQGKAQALGEAQQANVSLVVTTADSQFVSLAMRSSLVISY